MIKREELQAIARNNIDWSVSAQSIHEIVQIDEDNLKGAFDILINITYLVWLHSHKFNEIRKTAREWDNVE